MKRKCVYERKRESVREDEKECDKREKVCVCLIIRNKRSGGTTM